MKALEKKTQSSKSDRTQSERQGSDIVNDGCYIPGEGEMDGDFIKMLNRSQRTIFQICLLYTDRKSDSIQDLYQEIARTLLEAWPNFRGDSKTDTWVRRIAINVAVSEMRSLVRRPRFVPLEDWMYDMVSEESDKLPPDYYSIISALNNEERALIYMRLDKLSISEIAEVLSITEDAVKQRLCRLRNKIDKIKMVHPLNG